MSPNGVFDRRAQIRSLGSLPLYMTNQGRIEKGAAINEQLETMGIAPSALDMVLLSHLDCDHANGLKLVSGAKRILVSHTFTLQLQINKMDAIFGVHFHALEKQERSQAVSLDCVLVCMGCCLFIL